MTGAHDKYIGPYDISDPQAMQSFKCQMQFVGISLLVIVVIVFHYYHEMMATVSDWYEGAWLLGALR